MFVPWSPVIGSQHLEIASYGPVLQSSKFTTIHLQTWTRYRPYAGGVASRLAAIYVAMVTPILYDSSFSPNDSNMNVISLMVDFLKKIIKLLHLSIQFYGEWQKVAVSHAVIF